MSAPPRVRAHLRGTPDGQVPVVHRGRDAVYLDVGARIIGVVGRHAVAVPCALRAAVDHLDVTAAAVVGGELCLDGEPLRVGRMVDVSVPRLPVRRAHAAPPPGDIDRMVGRGDGLTPYDDDVLCGWLAVHRAAGLATPEVDAAVRARFGRTTLLSATLLDCAMHGEVIPEFAAYVAALDTPAEDGAAAVLAAVGHSSGRGLLHGARFALDQMKEAA